MGWAVTTEVLEEPSDPVGNSLSLETLTEGWLHQRRVPLLGIPKLGFYGNLPPTCISLKHLAQAKHFLSMGSALSETRRCVLGPRKPWSCQGG